MQLSRVWLIRLSLAGRLAIETMRSCAEKPQTSNGDNGQIPRDVVEYVPLGWGKGIPPRFRRGVPTHPVLSGLTTCLRSGWSRETTTDGLSSCWPRSGPAHCGHLLSFDSLARQGVTIWNALGYRKTSRSDDMANSAALDLFSPLFSCRCLATGSTPQNKIPNLVT